MSAVNNDNKTNGTLRYNSVSPISSKNVYNQQLTQAVIVAHAVFNCCKTEFVFSSLITVIQ
jgi:hypothetical protein